MKTRRRGGMMWQEEHVFRASVLGSALALRCPSCAPVGMSSALCPSPAVWRWWQHHRHGTRWRFRGSCIYSAGLGPQKVLDEHSWTEVSPCQIHAAEEYVTVVPQPQARRDMPVCSANSERGSLYVICINDLEIPYLLCFPLVRHLADCCILWDFPHSLK